MAKKFLKLMKDISHIFKKPCGLLNISRANTNKITPLQKNTENEP